VFEFNIADMVSIGLAVMLAAVALLGYRINQRCKVRRVWWSHVDGFLKERHEMMFSTPASNLGLALFSGALVGLFVVLLKAALRHHVAESFIFLTLWLPLVAGLLMVVMLPVVLLARWGARAVAGLKQAL
jgi:hypothetical protein